MTLTSRSKTLLVLLLQASGPVTSKELAGRMSLSPRVVRYSLDAVERWLATRDLPLRRKPNYGFEVDAPQQVRATLLRELRQLVPEDTILWPAERVHLILLLLFTADETIPFQCVVWINRDPGGD